MSVGDSSAWERSKVGPQCSSFFGNALVTKNERNSSMWLQRAASLKPPRTSIKTGYFETKTRCTKLIGKHLKSPFTAVTRVQIPSGTPNQINHLRLPRFQALSSR